MYIRDIDQEDREEAIGQCEGGRAFRIYSAAVRLLTTKALIDQSIGEISACVCGNFVTLPREVETVLGIQVDGAAVVARDSFFRFHINGPGDHGWTPCGMADILGNNFPTFRDPDRPVKLATRIYSASDANKKLRVFGYSESGQRIHTLGPDGNKHDGFYVPTVYGSMASNRAADPIVKIAGVSKERTAGFVDLVAVDPDTSASISVLARYAPDETSPAYTRIRVPQENVVRVRFRRRDIEVRTEDDWINVDDPEAFLLACKAVVKRRAGLYAEADACESTAARMIKQAQDRRQHGGVAPPQLIIDSVDSHAGAEDLFYPS